MASRISRRAAKSRCAWEWGAWGQLSEDGPGQHNPDRSEDPWGRAAEAARTEVLVSASVPNTERGLSNGSESTKGDGKPGAGKATSSIPALRLY